MTNHDDSCAAEKAVLRPNVISHHERLFCMMSQWTERERIVAAIMNNSPLLFSLSELLALKHESRILRHSSNPACGFSMMEQVRLCAVLPVETWLGSSLTQIQGWTTVRESYSGALEQGPLGLGRR